MIDEDEIVITDDEGKEKTYKILFTYENEQRGHSYVFVYDEESEDDEVNVYIYNESDSSLNEIEDDDEYSEAEEVFNAFIEDELI